MFPGRFCHLTHSQSPDLEAAYPGSEQVSPETSPFPFRKQKSLQSLSKQKPQIITKGQRLKAFSGVDLKICEHGERSPFLTGAYLKYACALNCEQIQLETGH